MDVLFTTIFLDNVGIFFVHKNLMVSDFFTFLQGGFEFFQSCG